jgi:uncharacterized membrane protein YbhN (UPF0104 family)
LARTTIIVVLLGLAVHALLPQTAELGQALQTMRSGRWPVLLLALIGAAGSFLGGAWMVRSSVDGAVPIGRTFLQQIAASAAAIFTPLGVGWVVVTQGYLRKEGVETNRAQAATGLNMVLTVLSHVALLVVLLPFLPALSLPKVTPPQRRIAVDVAVVVFVIGGLALWIPRIRKQILKVGKPILQAIPDVLRNPRRSAEIFLGGLLLNASLGMALYASLSGFGGVPSPVAVIVAYLVAATVAAISPTPGGLGAMEAALVAALTRLGVSGGQAVAGALTFRLATFWIPLLVGSVILRSFRKKGRI